MTYKEAYIQFSTAFAEMQKQLENWIIAQGGTIDEEGNVSGLSPNNEIHYEKRNAQLEAMLEFVEAVEGERKEQNIEIQRLKTRCKMLETAAKAEKYTDDYVLQNIEFIKKWEISEETTLDEFNTVLKETVFFIELASKRHLIPMDEFIMKKLNYAKEFLKDKNEIRFFFFNKKEKLKKQSAIPLLDEYTANLAKPA